jgi:S1-C subfamily serine protease
MRRVADLMTDVASAIAEAPEKPHFFESQAKASHPTQQSGDRPYFGSIPDFGVESPGGYAISGVTKGGPADVGGLKGGDIITHCGGTKITGLDDFDGALRQHRAGDKVPLVVKRDGKEVNLEVTLEPPR